MAFVLDEEIAKTSPCTCYEYDGKYICWSHACIGTLTDEQEKMFCNPRIVKGEVSEKTRERWKQFSEMAEYCSVLVSIYPKGKRLIPYLECISREAKKRNIQI